MHIIAIDTIKRGDTAVNWTSTLTQNGSAIDLTGCTVQVSKYSLSVLSGSLLSASIVTATSGSVTYTPTAADVAATGSWAIQWKVTYPDTTVLTIPSEGYIKLNIEDNLV